MMSWTNSVRTERERGVPVRGRRLVLRLTRDRFWGIGIDPFLGSASVAMTV